MMAMHTHLGYGRSTHLGSQTVWMLQMTMESWPKVLTMESTKQNPASRHHSAQVSTLTDMKWRVGLGPMLKNAEARNTPM